jgi:hypothetical protein
MDINHPDPNDIANKKPSDSKRIQLARYPIHFGEHDLVYNLPF